MLAGLVLTTFATALCAVPALAMPTQAELKKAQPLVAELMAPAMADFKSAGAKDKAAAAVKVADKSVEFASSAETEAAKFLLLKGAVNFYVRGESYDKAADTVTVLQANVKDVTPSVIAEITGKATGKISETKAPRLFALYRAAKLQVRAETEAKTLAKKLKTVKSDALQRRYAEALAVSGNWKTAYGEFAKLSDAKLKAVVEAEAKGQPKNAESGEFWWTYESTMEGADDCFKSHAAAFYRKALDAGEITGLKKNIVEQRIAGIAVEAAPSGGTPKSSASVCVTDGKYELKTGGKSPFEVKGDNAVLTLEDGTKVEFVKCSPGNFEMFKSFNPESVQKVSITRPFWVSTKVISHRQLHALTDYALPKDVEKGIPWISQGRMAEERGNVCGRLNERVGAFVPKGFVFRLPTIAEYEYASVEVPKLVKDTNATDWTERHGALNKFDVLLDRYTSAEVATVDDSKVSKLPRVQRYTVDLAHEDPFFWTESGDSFRVAKEWAIQNQVAIQPGKVCGHFHLVIGPDLVSEWKAKKEGKSVAAAASSASATSSGSGKAWQEKGNTAWLTLPNGEKLEFAKCPAGAVELPIGIMNQKDYAKVKRVRISRPFWITTSPVAQRCLKGYAGYAGGSDDPTNYAEGYYDDVVTFANMLTDELKDSLPKGFAVRLPSFAEWDYSFHAGSRDPDDPYANFDVSRRKENLDRCRKCLCGGCDAPCAKRGATVKNRWGLYDYGVAFEKLLDRVDDGNAVPHEKWTGDRRGGDGNVDALKQDAVADVDPLCWSENPNALPLKRLQSWKSVKTGHKFGVFRLVVGPDLVSEWKAKHGKK